jgi:VanZ family protein
MLLRRLSLLLALAWMAYIFYLSNQPSLNLPQLFPNQDKVMHFGAYAVLGTFILGALPMALTGFSSAQLALATLLASLYGISDEFHQSFVPGRSPDVLDWLADTSGALTATLLLAWLSRRLLRKNAQSAA